MNGQDSHKRKKGQHTVPRFYLRNFATADSHAHVIRCDRQTLKISPSAIKRTSVVDDVYTQTAHPDPMILEEAFSEVENHAARALRALMSTGQPSLKTRTIIAIFLATQLKRTTFFNDRYLREVQKLRDPATVCEFVECRRVQYEARFGKAALDKFLADVRSGVTSLQLDRGRLLLEGQKRFKYYATAILEMKWTLLRSPSGDFITSDNPVFCRRRGRPLDPGIVGVERTDLNAELYAPVSSNHFLIASWHHNREPRVAKPLRIRELNRLVVLCSNREVYGRRISDDVCGLVREHRGFRLELPDWTASELAQ